MSYVLKVHNSNYFLKLQRIHVITYFVVESAMKL